MPSENAVGGVLVFHKGYCLQEEALASLEHKLLPRIKQPLPVTDLKYQKEEENHKCGAIILLKYRSVWKCLRPYYKAPPEIYRNFSLRVGLRTVLCSVRKGLQVRR
ncbi:hypothetical protein RRG08_034224 [Elysia crispata]|uniref:Uncharacterized protein n=1 Tax=Elysia crispata TaxID=231223 RepID=A0AAE1DRG3_9GAST|nr:hypothetical protein RRG08_034224 [Elysia crispata]